MKVSLVWRIRPDGLFETQWIRELLAIGGVDYEEVFDLDGTTVVPRAVVVFNHSIDYEAYFQKYEDAGVKYGAIHLSDETLSDSYDFYGHKACVFVFRNYYHPVILSKYRHVVTLGLGYKSGFAHAQDDKPASPRYYHWSFAGNIHTPERLACLTPMMGLVPYKVHTTNAGFNSATGLSVQEYRALMDDSKFVICPIGQGNIDSFRVYEALEAGAIPIVLAATPIQPYKPSYWHAIFPWMRAQTIPMVIHHNWDDAAKTIREILQNKATYEDLRQQVATFWDGAKRIWAGSLAAYCLMLASVIHDDLEYVSG